MKKKLLILVIILVVLILVLISMGIFYFLNPKYKIAETKTFAEIQGFSFDYPVFKGWNLGEPKTTENSEIRETTAIIILNNSANADFYSAMQIKIVKSGYPYKGPNNTTIEDNPNIKTSKNGAKYYMNLHKNSENALGLPFVNFYASDSIITIYPFMREGDGYSGKVFVNKIIETFKFSQ